MYEVLTHRHGAHAVFAVQAKNFNGGIALGLLRAADSRMAGHFYGLHRSLRQKPALKATVSSVQWKSLKLGSKDKVTPVVESDVRFVNKKITLLLEVVLKARTPPAAIISPTT